MKILTYRTKKETLQAISDFESLDIIDYIYNIHNSVIAEGFIDAAEPYQLGQKKWVIRIRFTESKYACLSEELKWVYGIFEFRPTRNVYTQVLRADEIEAERRVRTQVRNGHYYLDLSGLRIDAIPANVTLSAPFVTDLNIADTLVSSLDTEIICKMTDLKRLSLQRTPITEIPDEILSLHNVMMIEMSIGVKYNGKLANENKIATVIYDESI